MLRILIVVLCCCVICFGRPAENYARLLEYVNDVDPEGSYEFRYLTDDGTQRKESGKLETDGKVAVLKVQGSYEYVGYDGKIYRVTYEADENGYRAKTQNNAAVSPKGTGTFDPSIPQHAPIPSAALASLAGGGLG